MTVVELTKTDNTQVFVNLEMIIAYEFGTVTRLTLCTGATLEVLETKDAFKKYLP